MRLLFSVITICKNNLLGLQITETSVGFQNYNNFEWLVIDGASQDGTHEYLSKLDFDFLRWWSEPDRSHFDAMNKGIERARGEYLLFLNAGDRFHDNEVLTKTAECLEQGVSYNWLIGDAVDLLEDGTMVYKRARSLRYILHSLPSSHQAIFFQQGAIGEVRYKGEVYPISADYAFAAEIYRYGCRKVKDLRFPVCVFHVGGISSRDRTGLLKDAWKVQREILDIKLPARMLSYLYRYASMFLLDNSPSMYMRLRRIVDQWSAPKSE